MQVSFRLFCEGKEICEQELVSHIEVHGSLLCTINRYDGVICVDDSKDISLRIEDELPALVKNLCFLAIPDLLANKNVVLSYYSHYGYLRLDPEGWRILVSGDGIVAIRLMRNEFLFALYECGRRFIEFLKLLHGSQENSELEGLIHFLEEYEKIGRESLTSIKAMPERDE